MTAGPAFLLGWAIRSAAVATLALIICEVTRKGPAFARNMIWRSTLASSVLIGFLLLGGLQIRMPVLAPTPARATESLRSWISSEPLGDKAPGSLASTVTYSRPLLPEHRENAVLQSDLSFASLVGLVYLLGVAFFLMRWIVSLIRIIQVCKQSRPFERMESTLIANSPELRVPITLGWRRPVVVLPSDASSWPDSRLQAVLLHERAHISRSDWNWQTAATLYTAIQWFNPAAWLIASNIRSSAEECADDAVLAAGVTPSAYASDLLSFATNQNTSTAAAIGMARRNGINSRMKNILASGRIRQVSNKRAVASAGLTLGILGVALAVCSPTTSLIRATAPHERENKSTVADPNAFKAKFKDGTEVRVRFVGPGYSSALPVWAPDGSPTDDSPKKTGESYGPGPEHKDKNKVAVCFEYSGMASADNDFKRPKPMWHPAKLGGRPFKGGGAGGSYRQLTCIYQFEMPKWMKQADLEVSMGVGEFQEVADSKSGKGNLKLAIKSVSQHQHSGPTHARFGPITPEEKLAETDRIVHFGELTFRLPRAAVGKEWRLSAYDKDGKLQTNIITNDGYTMPMPGEPAGTVHATCFADPASIDRYVIEARNYEWIKFKGIHLWPNQPPAQ